MVIIIWLMCHVVILILYRPFRRYKGIMEVEIGYNADIGTNKETPSPDWSLAGGAWKAIGCWQVLHMQA